MRVHHLITTLQDLDPNAVVMVNNKRDGDMRVHELLVMEGADDAEIVVLEVGHNREGRIEICVREPVAI